MEIGEPQRVQQESYAQQQQQCQPQDTWVYKGEGNANVVFAYAGSDERLAGMVLRVRKQRAKDHAGCPACDALEEEIWSPVIPWASADPLTREVCYITHHLAPLLEPHPGSPVTAAAARTATCAAAAPAHALAAPAVEEHQHSSTSSRTALPPCKAPDADAASVGTGKLGNARLTSNQQPIRSSAAAPAATACADATSGIPTTCPQPHPMHYLALGVRLPGIPSDVTALLAAQERDVDGSFPGLLLPDHTTFAPRSAQGLQRIGPCVCVEVKPKAGFLPASPYITHDIKRRVPRFHLHMLLKHLKGKAPAMSRYSPLDLFSGDGRRMRAALAALIEAPYNNLKVFRNGVLVFGGKTELMPGAQPGGSPQTLPRYPSPLRSPHAASEPQQQGFGSSAAQHGLQQQQHLQRQQQHQQPLQHQPQQQQQCQQQRPQLDLPSSPTAGIASLHPKHTPSRLGRGPPAAPLADDLTTQHAMDAAAAVPVEGAAEHEQLFSPTAAWAAAGAVASEPAEAAREAPLHAPVMADMHMTDPVPAAAAATALPAPAQLTPTNGQHSATTIPSLEEACAQLRRLRTSGSGDASCIDAQPQQPSGSGAGATTCNGAVLVAARATADGPSSLHVGAAAVKGGSSPHGGGSPVLGHSPTFAARCWSVDELLGHLQDFAEQPSLPTPAAAAAAAAAAAPTAAAGGSAGAAVAAAAGPTESAAQPHGTGCPTGSTPAAAYPPANTRAAASLPAQAAHKEALLCRVLADVLQASGVLQRLLAVQQLDTLDVEGAAALYQLLLQAKRQELAAAGCSRDTDNSRDVGCRGNGIGPDSPAPTDEPHAKRLRAQPQNGYIASGGADGAAAHASAARQCTNGECRPTSASAAPSLAALPRPDALRLLRNYLTAATAKDCGVMITLQQVLVPQSHKQHLQHQQPQQRNLQQQLVATQQQPQQQRPWQPQWQAVVAELPGMPPMPAPLPAWLHTDEASGCTFLVRVALVDTDLKPLAKVPTHAVLDARIVQIATTHASMLDAFLKSKDAWMAAQLAASD